MGRRPVVQSITAIRLAAVEVLAVVGANVLDLAVVLQARRACLAVALSPLARVILRTDANPIANLQPFGLGTGTYNDTNDLVANAAWVVGWVLGH